MNTQYRNLAMFLIAVMMTTTFHAYADSTHKGNKHQKNISSIVMTLHLGGDEVAGEGLTSVDETDKSKNRKHKRKGARETLRKDRPNRHTLRLKITEKVSQQPQRQRRPKLSEHHLVIKAFDKNGNYIFEELVYDPRLVRIEGLDEQGMVESEVLYKDSVDIQFVVPNDPDISVIKIYQPSWTGKAFAFDLIAEMDVK